MNPFRLPILLSVALMLASSATVQAQTVAPAKTKPSKVSKTAKPVAPPPREAPLTPATPEQLEAANIAHLGDYVCEFNQTVSVEPSAKEAGYVDMKLKSQVWVMKPVLSSTGALRLEDVKNRMLMIQIANKSMVMDTQLGQRVVDDCVHEKQRAFIATQDSLLAPLSAPAAASAAATAPSAPAASAPAK